MPEYRLAFHVKAKKEWDKLGATVRLQFAQKLKERLAAPRVVADKLTSLADCYKIKLRTSGYRLVYQVVDDRLVVTVIAVGKRERSLAYAQAAQRLSAQAPEG